MTTLNITDRSLYFLKFILILLYCLMFLSSWTNFMNCLYLNWTPLRCQYPYYLPSQLQIIHNINSDLQDIIRGESADVKIFNTRWSKNLEHKSFLLEMSKKIKTRLGFLIPGDKFFVKNNSFLQRGGVRRTPLILSWGAI